jgi:hypothetical protein
MSGRPEPEKPRVQVVRCPRLNGSGSKSMAYLSLEAGIRDIQRVAHER